MEIGKKIRNLRLEKEVKQEELAEYLGVSIQAVSKWERCISLPDISMLSDLARLLEVSADWLLGLSVCRDWAEDCADRAAGDDARIRQVQQEMGSCLRGCLDPLELAFGMGLVPAFAQGASFPERIRAVKVRLAKEGIWTPIVRKELRSLLEIIQA